MTGTSILKDAVPSFIALVSICFNVYQFYITKKQSNILRRSEQIRQRTDEIRDRLYDMKQKLEATSLLDIDPANDLWEYGFETLEKLRDSVVSCQGRLALAPEGRVPRNIRVAVDRLADEIKTLYNRRDSYRSFANGKVITSLVELQKWPDIKQATHELSVLQAEYKANRDTIDNYLAGLEALSPDGDVERAR